MSAGGGGGAAPTGRRRGGTSQDFELNLASIIDCFTVLIAFMLVTASFLSIGVLDAGVAAAGPASASTEPPPINISVELSKDKSVLLKTVGKAPSEHKYTAKSGDWDYESLTGELNGLKAKWPNVSAVTLLAHNEVEYREVVRTMEVVKKSLPIVLLGGF